MMLLFNTTKFGVICYTAITSCLYLKWSATATKHKACGNDFGTRGWGMKVGRALKRRLAEV